MTQSCVGHVAFTTILLSERSTVIGQRSDVVGGAFWRCCTAIRCRWHCFAAIGRRASLFGHLGLHLCNHLLHLPQLKHTTRWCHRFVNTANSTKYLQWWQTAQQFQDSSRCEVTKSQATFFTLNQTVTGHHINQPANEQWPWLTTPHLAHHTPNHMSNRTFFSVGKIWLWLTKLHD